MTQFDDQNETILTKIFKVIHLVLCVPGVVVHEQGQKGGDGRAGGGEGGGQYT